MMNCEPQLNVEAKEISVYRNVLPENLCKHLIEKLEGTEFFLPTNKAKLKAVNLEDHPDDMFLVKNFVEICANKYLQQFDKKLSSEHLVFDSMFVARYNTGDAFPVHHDFLSGNIFTVMVILNDDYEGGDLIFPKQYVSIKGGTGDIIIFPTLFIYPHEVTTITKGCRNAIFVRLGYDTQKMKYG
jgi:hypothetical protein